VAAAVLLGAAAAVPAGAHDDGIREIVLTTRHSRFEPAHVEVAAGTRVRFVVRNLDPIDHELIVGDAGVHARHEHGTEAHHPPRPGEVTAPAGATAVTTYEFAEPGVMVFGCHLPGHWAYGMRGTVTVSSRT
jgi:uncharacterized cupredoxin-like copper-binding protein